MFFIFNLIQSTIISTRFQFWKLVLHYQVQKLRFVQDSLKFVENQYCALYIFEAQICHNHCSISLL
ncbi:hypothetical protein RchiOBHm_Chr2g0169471 [Rosa chinensis]|uniref:Uncharacterized protein n=1 Tax=Rosa chinensis TaxID=74649 RepID=A0A2P6S4V6_ROSCH|nr:hypothetical protein RchiOBHm_Chr2g0169471 [Rosa chinensis]